MVSREKSPLEKHNIIPALFSTNWLLDSAIRLYYIRNMRPNFEWDDVKNEQNKEKHGVSFLDAQYAFADPNRVIIEDLGHGAKEDL